MLEIRRAVPVPLQQHRQIVIDILLSEFVRQFLQIQYRLGDFKAVRVDGTVRILSQAEFLSKQRYAFPESGNSFNRLVQDVFGHGVLGVGD